MSDTSLLERFKEFPLLRLRIALRRKNKRTRVMFIHVTISFFTVNDGVGFKNARDFRDQKFCIRDSKTLKIDRFKFR